MSACQGNRFNHFAHFAVTDECYLHCCIVRGGVRKYVCAHKKPTKIQKSFDISKFYRQNNKKMQNFTNKFAYSKKISYLCCDFGINALLDAL